MQPSSNAVRFGIGVRNAQLRNGILQAHVDPCDSVHTNLGAKSLELHIGGFADAPHALRCCLPPASQTVPVMHSSNLAPPTLNEVTLGSATTLCRRSMYLGDPNVAPRVANTNARGRGVSTPAILWLQTCTVLLEKYFAVLLNCSCVNALVRHSVIRWKAPILKELIPESNKAWAQGLRLLQRRLRSFEVTLRRVRKVRVVGKVRKSAVSISPVCWDLIR